MQTDVCITLGRSTLVMLWKQGHGIEIPGHSCVYTYTWCVCVCGVYHCVLHVLCCDKVCFIPSITLCIQHPFMWSIRHQVPFHYITYMYVYSACIISCLINTLVNTHCKSLPCEILKECNIFGPYLCLFIVLYILNALQVAGS